LKALTENQVLLLKEIEKNSTKTVTSLVNKVARATRIPLSTLKLNARMLKKFGLVEYDNSNPVGLTESGVFILSILRGESG